MTFGQSPTRPARILVVENDEVIRLKAAGALEAAGYEVTITANTIEGLKKMYEIYPDVIIIARELPIDSGEDAYLRIRQASYLPIIVVGSRAEAAEMLELGADAYVTIPVSLSELVARVRALLRRKPNQKPPEGGTPGDIRKQGPGDRDSLSGLSFTMCAKFGKGWLQAAYLYLRLRTSVPAN